MTKIDIVDRTRYFEDGGDEIMKAGGEIFLDIKDPEGDRLIDERAEKLELEKQRRVDVATSVRSSVLQAENLH